MQVIGYFLFALSLFYMFFLWQFPYEGLRRAIILSFEENLPVNLLIQEAKPSLPLNLILEKIRMETGPLSVTLPDVKVDPDWLGLLSGQTRFAFTDPGNSDQFRGTYGVANQQGDLRLQAKELEIHASSGKQFSLRVSLSGEARLQWVGEDYARGQGQIWFSLRKIGMEAAPGDPLWPFLNLIDRLRAEIEVREGIYHLKRLDVEGKNLNRSFQGDFIISRKEKGALPDLSMLLQLPMK